MTMARSYNIQHVVLYQYMYLYSHAGYAGHFRSVSHSVWNSTRCKDWASYRLVSGVPPIQQHGGLDRSQWWLGKQSSGNVSVASVRTVCLIISIIVVNIMGIYTCKFENITV